MKHPSFLFLPVLGAGLLSMTTHLGSGPGDLEGAKSPITNRFVDGQRHPLESGRLGACAPGAPIELSVQVPDGGTDFLVEPYLGTFEVFVGATSLAPVSVQVFLSDGLTLNQGELAFTDAGEGMLLVLERREETPQTISVQAIVNQDGLEPLATLDSWGAPLESQVSGAVLQELVDGDEQAFLLIPSTDEGGE